MCAVPGGASSASAPTGSRRSATSSRATCSRSTTSSSASRRPEALLGEERPRERELRARLALAGHLHQPRVITARRLGITGHLCGERRAIEAAEAVRLALLRLLVLLQRLGRALQLHQHVAEQLACRQDAAGRHRMLVVPVLEVRGFAREAEPL